MNKKKTVKILIYFFIFMFIMTIVSRGIYAYRLPKVTVTNPQFSSLDHSVNGEGMVKENTEEAIVILPNIRVDQVLVKEGEIIEEGDVLFTLNEDDINEQIKLLQNDIAKAKLLLSDIQANEALAAAEKQKKIDRAAEDYNSTIASSNRKVGEASQDVSKAEEEYDDLPSKDSYIDDAVSNSSAGAKERLNTLQKEKKDLEDEKVNLENESPIDPVKIESNNKAILDKEEKIVAAQNSLDAIISSTKSSAGDEWESKKEALTDAIALAQRNYNSTVENKNSSEKTATRNVEDSKGTEKQDSTKKINEMTLQEKQEQLKKYQSLLESGTNIVGPKRAAISKVNVEAGGKTPDMASILYADMSGVLSFDAVISEEDQKKIAIGDNVSLSFHNGSDKTDEAVLAKMEADEIDTSKYNIEITMNEPIATIGEMGEFTIKNVSADRSLLVPLSAIHSDGLKYYVYVMDSKETILGEELKASKKGIEIADKNDRYASIDNSGLSEEDKIIISSSKDIADGSVVRLLTE